MERTVSRMPTVLLALCLLMIGGLVLAQLAQFASALPKQPHEVLGPAKPEPLPPLIPHALEHQEAPLIHQYLSTHDTRWCRFDCGAKGTKYYCRIGQRTALAVVVEGVKTITAFWVSKDYDYDPRNDPGCKPFINAEHQ